MRSSELRGIRLPEDAVPAIVDELPILAVAAAFAEGRFQVRGTGQLRVKESDRIQAMGDGPAPLPPPRPSIRNLVPSRHQGPADRPMP